MKDLIEAMLKTQEFIGRLQQANALLSSVTTSYKWPEAGSIANKMERGLRLLKEAREAILTGQHADRVAITADLEIFVDNKGA